METIQDFKDMLYLLEKHRVRYLVIGGLAVIHLDTEGRPAPFI